MLNEASLEKQNSRSVGSKQGYKDIRSYLEALESACLLKRIKVEVDLKHELGAICARSLDREAPALLKVSRELMSKVAGRWKEFNLS